MNYIFKKLTIFNNSGAFGSDLVKYRIAQRDTEEFIGEIIGDIYYNSITLHCNDRVFELRRKFWKGLGIFEKGKGKRMARLKLSGSFLAQTLSMKMTFENGEEVKFSINDFVNEKAYKIKCSGNKPDVLLDFLVQHPRPNEPFMFLREIPLTGEIQTSDATNPFVVVCIIAALEFLILNIDYSRRNRSY